MAFTHLSNIVISLSLSHSLSSLSSSLGPLMVPRSLVFASVIGLICFPATVPKFILLLLLLLRAPMLALSVTLPVSLELQHGLLVEPPSQGANYFTQDAPSSATFALKKDRPIIMGKWSSVIILPTRMQASSSSPTNNVHADPEPVGPWRAECEVANAMVLPWCLEK